MSKAVPDAWDDEWSNVADKTTKSSAAQTDTKRISSKVTKAQKRAQQAEFNRQLWAEAEGPREPNYFLESRNAVPLRSEFKPPPVLLSRKGPPIVRAPRPDVGVQDNAESGTKVDSSEDEDEVKVREQTLAERKVQAAKDREEKQRKYEERRQELFGTTSTNSTNLNGRPSSRSGTSTPNSLTPPGSRSSTPSRGRGRGRGRGAMHNQSRQQPSRQQELFDPNYSAKPDSTSVRKRDGSKVAAQADEMQRPVRTPRGPDGSGRGGYGFSSTRESRHLTELANDMAEAVLSP